MQDLAVVPLWTPDSDAESDSDTQSTKSEPRIVREHTSDCADYNKLPPIATDSSGTCT